MPTDCCKHVRTLLVAKDEHEEYRECLDCGEIFDPAERESTEQRTPSFGETLRRLIKKQALDSVSVQA